MTTTTKPAYLEPTQAVSPSAKVVYEPPLEIGTLIRAHGLLDAPGDTVEIVGFGVYVVPNPDGTTREEPYAFGLWDSHKEPSIFDFGSFQEHCDREGIDDIEAYLKTDSGRNWLSGGHKVGDQRRFKIGDGRFHSALLGTEWVPVFYEMIRTQTQPVLGWSVSKSQSAFRKRSGTENGHKGVIRQAGKYARESTIERRRWTTTLSIEALEVLDRMSSEMGLHRNEVVEQLVARADALLRTRQPQKAAPMADGDDELKRRKRLTKAEGTQLDQELLELIRNGGATNDELQRLADAKGQKLRSIRSRFRGLEKVEQQRHQRHANNAPSSTYD